MQCLSYEQLHNVSGGEEGSSPNLSLDCRMALVNYMKHRNDLFESYLKNGTPCTQASVKMHHFQQLAIENCSFETMHETGTPGFEVFL
jgi:hypothetical protein